MDRNLFDDAKLNSPEQEKMRELVANMPDESLSLAWRSTLNEKLRETAAASRRRRRFVFVLRPAMGLAAAGALAAVLMIRVNEPSIQPVASNGNLEAALVQDHRQNVSLSDVVGLGVNPYETRSTTEYGAEAPGWSEVDLESL